MKISVLSRSSPLALLQVQEALPALRSVFSDAEFLCSDTNSLGDRDLTTPLIDPSVPTDYFTRELDLAQLTGDVDLVIHSAKDLPSPLPDGLCIGALLPAADTRDALVFRDDVEVESVKIIGTSSATREAEILKQFPDARCKGIRGTIEQRLAQLDSGDYDAVIIAACALHRLGLASRIGMLLDYPATPQQGRLAITVREDRNDLLRPLRRIDVRRTAGLVACIGCPADASLLAAHARTLLDAADVVLHDRLIPPVILKSLHGKAEYVGKRGHGHSTTQNHIHRRLLEEAERGKLVVRLQGGDPGILGHLGETLEFCQDWNLRVEIVPAVSASQLAAARSHASLTHRYQGRSITFLSGHAAAELEHLPLPSPEFGNLCIYMGVRNLSVICERMRDAGWDESTEVTVSERLGMEGETLTRSTLAEVASLEFTTPAVFLFGPEGHPGPGYTLFTGTTPSKFYKFGPLLHYPFIQLSARKTDSSLQGKLAGWDGVIFPSSFSVDCFIEQLLAFGDLRDLSGKRVLAVGPMTAATLRGYGLQADAAPDDFGGVIALAALDEGKHPGTFGYPCSNLAPTRKRQAAVADSGIILDPVVLYDNVPLAHTQLPNLPFSRVLFTSSSTVQNYFDSFPEERDADREWLAVGTSTLQTLRENGLTAFLLGE